MDGRRRQWTGAPWPSHRPGARGARGPSTPAGLAGTHPTMANQTKCFKKAEDGFANGADWYSRNHGKAVEGTLRDFSYLFTSNMELVVSLACCKFNTRPK